MRIKKWRFSGFALGLLLMIFFFTPFLPLSAEESAENNTVVEIAGEPLPEVVAETENPSVSVAAIDEEPAASDVTETDVGINRSLPSSVEEKSVSLSHFYQIVEEVAATCEEPGYTIYLCEYCDRTYQVTTPALGHDYYISNQVNASCEHDGLITFQCSRCNSSYTEILPALGHDYCISSQANAGCEHDGFITYQCSRCKSSYTEILPALGHDFQVCEEVEAGCEHEGHITSICSRCKEEKTEYLPAKGHLYHEVGRTQPTESADGCIEYICSRCQNKMIEPLPATGNEANLAESDNLSEAAKKKPSKSLAIPYPSTEKTVPISSLKESDEGSNSTAVTKESVASASLLNPTERAKGGMLNMCSIILISLTLSVVGLGAGYALSYRILFIWAAQKKAAAIRRFAEGGAW